MEANIELNSEELDRLILGTLKDHKSRIPGLAVGIVVDGKLAYFKGEGFANVEKKVPISQKTVFRMASVSKIFTTIGIMQLCEQGKFQLDDPVNKFLQAGSVGKKKDDWPDVTFRHLLSHQAGFGELLHKTDVLKGPWGFGLNIAYPKEIPPLSYLHDRTMVPDAPAGLKNAYSNYGFSLLGYLIEQISGMEFVEYIRHHILNPLGMSLSDFVQTDAIKEQEAQGYVVLGRKLRHAKYWQSIIKPAGNLYSNVEDMVNFAQMLMNGGQRNGSQILKPETLNICWEPQYYSHEVFKDEYALGLAFHLYNFKGHQIIEHNGATSGFHTCFTVVPRENIAVIVLSNLDQIFRTDQTMRIKNSILHHVLDLLPTSPKSIESKMIIKYTEAELEKYRGYYAPYPGILSNTRVMQAGADFKITPTEQGIQLKSLYGPYRKAVQFFPTEKPHVFHRPLKPGSSILTDQKIAFELDEEDVVSHYGLGFFRLRKRKFSQTLRFNLIVFVSTFILSSVIFFTWLASTLK